MNAKQTVDELRPRVRAAMPDVRAGLERLARIPSLSAPGYDPAPVRETARVTAELFTAAGVNTRVLEREGAHPAVVGRVEGPKGSPTVLLYAHHDVQPPGPRDRWRTDPFTPTGGLPGRREGDAALRRGDHRRLIELAYWRARDHHDAPGNALVTVEVRVSDHAVHSGQFGGVVPDALMVLTRLLASLHDDQGRVAVTGLVSGDMEPLDLAEGELRGWVGTRPSVKLIGDGSLTSRLWRKPSISIIGIDATPVREASNTLWPVAAARLSMRVPIGQNAKKAQDALVAHLESHVPWGAELAVTRGPTGEAFSGPTSGPAYAALKDALGAAWGREAIDVGQGGSIPFLFDVARTFPGAALLVTGVEDPESNAHSENESLHLAEFENVCVAEATFLGLFGASGRG